MRLSLRMYFADLIKKGKFQPAVKQISGDHGWAVRVRLHNNRPVIHFMNTALTAIPHPEIKDNSGTPILKDIQSKVENNLLSFEIDTRKIPLEQLAIMSPEIGEEKRKGEVKVKSKKLSVLNVNLDKIKVYAVVS